MQALELLHENLDVLHQAVHNHSDSSLIEENGKPGEENYYTLYELNDELFLFHFSKTTLSHLFVFENVPAALEFMRTLNKP